MNSLSRGLLAVVVVGVLAGCAGSGGSTGSAASTAPSAPTVVATVSSAPSTGPENVDVSLTDNMRITPDSMTVHAGRPVTFVVTNAGKIAHEFTVGDGDVQNAHELEMTSMGGMAHDEDNAITVAPGETKELTYTFDTPGASLAGCHVQGHYPAGMKATITIV